MRKIQRVTKADKEVMALAATGIITSVLLGEPVDTEKAEKVFASARIANKRFVDMTDDEIVEYCQGLDEQQLQGTVSLIKGRYFEEEVAEITGGTLFEAKNHPGVDITIDGQEIQLKAGGYSKSATEGTIVHTPEDYNMSSEEITSDVTNILVGDVVVDVALESIVDLSIAPIVAIPIVGIVRGLFCETQDEKIKRQDKEGSMKEIRKYIKAWEITVIKENVNDLRNIVLDVENQLNTFFGECYKSFEADIQREILNTLRRIFIIDNDGELIKR